MVPVAELVALMTGSALVRSTAETQADPEIKAEGQAGDLLDDSLTLALTPQPLP